MLRCAQSMRAPGRGAHGRAIERSVRSLGHYQRGGWSIGVLGMCLLVVTTAIADDSNRTFEGDLVNRNDVAGQIARELHVEVLEEGASARRTRRSAEGELPMARLTPVGKKLADAVLADLTLHRRLPVIRLESDPRVVQFFLQHPDVAVDIWRAMDISDMQLTLISPHRYRTDSGDGSSGTMTMLISDPNQALVHCEGVFKSPVLSRAINASALFWIRTEHQRDKQGKDFVKCTADLFIAFPATTIDAAARIISPVSNRVADRNFQEVAMFVRMMHLGMTQQPGWVEDLANRLQNVTDERSQALIDTTAKVYADSQRRLTGLAEPTTSTPEGLRLPARRESEASAAGQGSPAGGRAIAPVATGPERATIR